jgi:hypothetical protein
MGLIEICSSAKVGVQYDGRIIVRDAYLVKTVKEEAGGQYPTRRYRQTKNGEGYGRF